MNVFGFLRDSSLAGMGAVQYYRTFLPLRELDAHDNGISAMCAGAKELQGATDDEIGGRDIYTMCRMYQDADTTKTFVDEIHRRGGLVVFDSDDDLTETHRLVSGRGDEFKRVLGIVDYVTTSTPVLGAAFSEYAKEPIRVLRNHVDVEWMQKAAGRAPRFIDELVIGFSGSDTHWADWILPSVAFADIGRMYPDVTLAVHGFCPRYLKHTQRDDRQTLHMDKTPYAFYPTRLKQFDVVLCAVEADDGFSAGKSAVKALECMALGVVPICSRFGPYMDLKEQGAPIVVIEEETRDAWFWAMNNIIENGCLRKKLSDMGPGWVRKNRDMAQVGHRHWENFYREITNKAG